MVVKRKSSAKRKRVARKAITASFIFLLMMLVAVWISSKYYNKIFGSNVLATSGSVEVFIPSNPTYQEVHDLLKFSGVLVSIDDFDWVAHQKGATDSFQGGRYLLTSGMSNNDLVNMLRGGYQSAVRVTFTNIRTAQELAGLLSSRLEPDSLSFLAAFKNDSLLKTLNIPPHLLMGRILPNTYEMWWTTTPEGFLKRMVREYNNFWNSQRRHKANSIGLSPDEVATLASIVDEETVKADEKGRVAGLYINRLNRNMRLQADPTIKFVLNDFTIKRVLKKYLTIDSPYNTYLYAGLPPGPIRMPSLQGIEAVLNFEEHNYLYMCARDDFSGYHNFARTLQQHNQNAARYQAALQKLKIYK